MYGHRFARVELQTGAVSLSELVPHVGQIAVQQDSLEVLEQLIAGEFDRDFRRACLHAEVFGVEQSDTD